MEHGSHYHASALAQDPNLVLKESDDLISIEGVSEKGKT